MTTFTFQPLIRTLIVTFALFSGSEAIAASACKGQTDAACGQNDSCYWVTGYKRSDGANVKGHCRAKPQSSLKDSAKSPAKKESDSAKNDAENAKSSIKETTSVKETKSVAKKTEPEKTDSESAKKSSD